jgi:glycosyltransferase involved in cell wall biosynthesis
MIFRLSFDPTTHLYSLHDAQRQFPAQGGAFTWGRFFSPQVFDDRALTGGWREMKVIFSHSTPFFLAHGGIQTLTEAVMREVAALGVEVEPERWWDERQKGDILHYIARPSLVNVRSAKQKGIKVVITENIGQTATRSPARLWAQRRMMDLARAVLPSDLLYRVNWDVYVEADALVFVVENERKTAEFLYRTPPGRCYVIPHGLDPQEIQKLAEPQPEQDYLVSMATIYPVKNTVLLAQAAHLAQIPVVFLGRPYSDNDPYFLDFKKLVDGKIVRYPGFVQGQEKFRWLRGARGFALVSHYESGCIAVHEAAAAGLPLFLSALPWADAYRNVSKATFVRPTSASEVAPRLKSFYAEAHRGTKPTFPVITWRQVGEQYVEMYRTILGK